MGVGDGGKVEVGTGCLLKVGDGVGDVGEGGSLDPLVGKGGNDGVVKGGVVFVQVVVGWEVEVGGALVVGDEVVELVV